MSLKGVCEREKRRDKTDQDDKIGDGVSRKNGCLRAFVRKEKTEDLMRIRIVGLHEGM